MQEQDFFPFLLPPKSTSTMSDEREDKAGKVRPTGMKNGWQLCFSNRVRRKSCVRKVRGWEIRNIVSLQTDCCQKPAGFYGDRTFHVCEEHLGLSGFFQPLLSFTYQHDAVMQERIGDMQPYDGACLEQLNHQSFTPLVVASKLKAVALTLTFDWTVEKQLRSCTMEGSDNTSFIHILLTTIYSCSGMLEPIQPPSGQRQEYILIRSPVCHRTRSFQSSSI